MSTLLEPKTLKDADDFLDRDEQLTAFRVLGEELFAVFGTDREGRISSQIRNLQQLAISARRLADVEDFIKNQMGKSTQASRDWRKVGDRVLEHLALLRKQANTAPVKEQQLQLRLHLVRGWVRAVVGAYLYAKARKEMSPNHV